MWHRRNRQEALTILSAAKTTYEVEQAVGNLGIFIPLRDGSWIAIRYRDTHRGYLASLAIARDSGGNWYESDHHYCGEFIAYKHDRRESEELHSEPAEPGEVATNARSESFAALDAVFNAPSLEVGRQRLLKLGFETIDWRATGAPTPAPACPDRPLKP